MPNAMGCDVTVGAMHFPEDINAEILLDYFPGGTFDVRFCGLHKRNSYMDILGVEQSGGRLSLSLGRNSIYHSLPEYVFHAIDRFERIPQREMEERFAQECAKQEKEKEDACKFFAPLDTMLLQLRIEIRRALDKYVKGNVVIQGIVLDSLTEEQKANRFVKRTAPYITSCKYVRGNRTLLTLLLRKVFMDEGISVSAGRQRAGFTDVEPRYGDSLGGPVGEVYAGNSYDETVVTYVVDYWSDGDCDEEFPRFLHELEVYRQFVQDYFLSVDALLVFDVKDDAPPLRLSDTDTYNYLNYNTNI